MINKLFKSVLEQDREPVVICDSNDIIVYMNPSAISCYHKDLTGKSIKDCHPEEANIKLEMVVNWFKESIDNNFVHTYYDKKENKDVYMIALRDEEKNLIGYYEKHESRNRETMGAYHHGLL